MGNCLLELKYYPETENKLQRLLEISSTGYEVANLHLIYNNLGRIGLIRGNFAGAAEHFQKALELSENIGSLDHAAGMCLTLSNAFSHLGKPDTCKAYLPRAQQIHG